MTPECLARLLPSCLALLAFTFSGCLAKTSDKILSEARSPSGKWTVTVVHRDAGVMTDSIMVFLHPASKTHASGEPLIALTGGTAPTVQFVDDTTLRVRLFDGTKHNQRKEALGLKVLYE